MLGLSFLKKKLLTGLSHQEKDRSATEAQIQEGEFPLLQYRLFAMQCTVASLRPTAAPYWMCAQGNTVCFHCKLNRRADIPFVQYHVTGFLCGTEGNEWTWKLLTR